MLYTNFAKCILNDNKKDREIKTKCGEEISKECKYINALYNKNEFFNCCTIINEFNEGIILKMLVEL